jgi:hypothetical protein
MKHLPTNAGQPNWDSSFLQNLSYIKKHLRYPIKKKTLGPVIFWAAIFTVVISTGIFFLFNSDGKEKNVFFILFLFNAITYPIFIFRYLQTLRFQVITTEHFTTTNSELIEQFLRSQQLLVFRHPEAPEVYQILSRNIDASSEDREVLVFIADDKRILINSHFTNKGWSYFQGKRHHKEMAKMLKEYIKQDPSDNSSIIRQN